MSPSFSCTVPALALGVSAALSLQLAGGAPAGIHVDRQETSAAATRSHSSVGAPVGIGDPYFPWAGNPGYDVRHYGIVDGYDPKTQVLTGLTKVTLRAKHRLRSFNLDLLPRASSVTIAGRRVRFSQTRHELTVHPRAPIPQGRVVTAHVAFRGKPVDLSYDGQTPFEQTTTGAIAVGEPDIAAWWFASNDHPSDKATFDITLRVPPGYQGISNGILRARRTTPGGSRWHWVVRSPMATYLAFGAVGHYTILRGTTASGLPYLYAFEHGLSQSTLRAARRSLKQTPTILRWLERRWGPYPFKTVGGVVPNVALHYALENQTRPVYGRDMFAYGPSRSLIVHELAHQWFGDRVSLKRWRSVWLNEGFATYSEWLWEQSQGGRSPQQQLMNTYHAFGAGSSLWKLPIGDPGAKRLFDEAVYQRDAMATQALRDRIGSKDFFRLMRAWVRTNKDGVGGTPEFKRLAEHVSGAQLDSFFAAWVYAGSKPAATASNGL